MRNSKLCYICLLAAAIFLMKVVNFSFAQELSPQEIEEIDRLKALEQLRKIEKIQQRKVEQVQAPETKQPAAPQAPQEDPDAEPIMEIKPFNKEETLFSIELRDVEIADLLRMLAHNYNLNIWMDKDVKGKVTASFSNITLEEAIKTVAESSNFVFKREGNVIKVIPDIITQIFPLKYIEVRELLKTGEEQKDEALKSAHATIFDLLSKKGKILLGELPNSIMVIDFPNNIKDIEKYLELVDQPRTYRVFKLKYLSVSNLFPELDESEREKRQKQREEIEEERKALGKVGILDIGGK